VRAPDFGGRLTWKMTPVTTLKGYVDRTVDETVLFGTSSYITTLSAVSLEHKFSKDLEMTTDISYFNSNFQGSQRLDDVISLGAGLKYFVTKEVFVGSQYRFTVRDSNVFSQNYQRNQATVLMGLEF
jgi:uncharacterized protein (PEP-CTERM system associated)